MPSPLSTTFLIASGSLALIGAPVAAVIFIVLGVAFELLQFIQSGMEG